MIGLDTNVLVRYIVQDDPDQSAAAERLIEGRCTAQAPGYVSVLVLAELVWVLTSAYDYKKVAVIPVIRQLLRAAELAVEDRQTVWAALREFDRRRGFRGLPDCASQRSTRMYANLHVRSAGGPGTSPCARPLKTQAGRLRSTAMGWTQLDAPPARTAAPTAVSPAMAGAAAANSPSCRIHGSSKSLEPHRG